MSNVSNKGDDGDDDDVGNNEKAGCLRTFSRRITDRVSRSTRTTRTEEVVEQEMKWQGYYLATM